MCAGVLKLGIDFVYSSNKLGTQSAISNAMNDNSQSFQDIVDMHDTECVEQVLRFVCLYYLPPCGNATHVSSHHLYAKKNAQSSSRHVVLHGKLQHWLTTASLPF